MLQAAISTVSNFLRQLELHLTQTVTTNRTADLIKSLQLKLQPGSCKNQPFLKLGYSHIYPSKLSYF